MQTKPFYRLSCAFLACALLGTQIHAQQESEEEELYELSPFTVQGEDSQGYSATSTLAGTRIKTSLRDVGSAITVLTREIFDDTGATDAGTVLAYSTNTEVSGPQGNFGNPDFSGDRANPSAQQRSPQDSQRVRGLAQATLTRGYFLTDIPFDDYNTDRVTINRGPNSLLFGIGTPGGIINNGLRLATLSESFGSIGVRIGERSSHRETLDVNQVIIEDRVAVRIAFLNETTNYQQRPTYEDDQRFYIAFEATLAKNENSDVFGRTILRGNFEDGEIDGSPPSILPPVEGISNWFSLPDRGTYQAITGTTLPAYIDNGTWSPKLIVDSSKGRPFASYPAPVGDYLSIQLPIVYQTPTSQVASVGLASNSNIAGVMGRVIWRPATSGGRVRYDTIGSRSLVNTGTLPGFRGSTINDTQVLDNRKLSLFGNLNHTNQEFSANNLALEQSFFNGKAGIELAYDKQRHNNYAKLPFDQDTAGNGGALDLWVDMNSHLSNGEANPNVGKVAIRTRGSPRRYNQVDREAKRATAFVDFDLTQRDGWTSWLGRHVFTGLYNEQEIEHNRRDRASTWTDASPATDVANILFANKTQGRIFVPGVYYLTDSLLDSSIQSFSDVRFTQAVTSPTPMAGEVYRMSYNIPRTPQLITNADGQIGFIDDFQIEDTLWIGNRTMQNIESQAVSWQSYFWDGNIVGLLGWRKDKSDNFELASPTTVRLPNGEVDEASLILGDKPSLSVEGETITKSILAHMPFELPGGTEISFHYNESENFAPSGVRRDALNTVLPNPTGTTEEYGVTFEFLDRRLSARLNWYETTSDYSTADVGGASGGASYWIGIMGGFWHTDAELSGFPIEQATSKFNSYQEVYDAIESIIPPELWKVYNIQLGPSGSTIESIKGLSATESFISEGVELELAGAINDNWNVFLNISKQESTRSNIANAAFELAQTIAEKAKAANLWDLKQSPSVGDAVTGGVAFTNNTLIPLAGAKTRENTVALEQRKWRANLITTYNFNDRGDWLSGIGLGGALRWQDAAATGYELDINSDGLQVPDLNNPFFGPAELNGDLWVNYRCKLMDGKIDWKIQLNIRNLIGDQDMVPVVTNPDGIVAVTRNPPSKEVFLSNTFSF
ncbi:MAG: TonB-dependent receptor plug domain-containing protein [Verrucomicrobia bacterium]|nr:TonB-dependent receptor plug domain-containing protein [Verrucomicrobiota bacterium]MDA1069172.1 TonB-dependent receptor plug domain-containing protein [Verrucomicrobiota bacterium]